MTWQEDAWEHYQAHLKFGPSINLHRTGLVGELIEDAVPLPSRSLTAAGGWCAPLDTRYAPAHLSTNAYTALFESFPVMRILRPGTPEWEENEARRENQRAMEQSIQQLVHRHIGDIARAQDRAITEAWAYAEALGMDLLLEYPPPHHTQWRWTNGGNTLAAYHHIGLQLVERSTETWRRLQGDRAIIIRETAATDDYWDD